MWFKNLVLFRLTEPFELSQDELESRLNTLHFHGCGELELSSCGWTSPLGRGHTSLTHSISNCTMLCAMKEEKILPSAVVNEIVSARIEETESRQNRPVRKKEREAVREAVFHELLPRAFSHSRRTYAYIDAKRSWLVIDSASAKAAEEFCSLLRKALGTLPAVYPVTAQRPSVIMTQWLRENASPADITVEDECELRSAGEDGSTIRCKRQDLSVPEIQHHLEAGKEVIRMALTWSDQMTFVLDEALSLKRLRFLDLVQDQAADMETGNRAEQFDADFSIMSLALGDFLPRLLELFGGENYQSYQNATNR